MNNQDYVTHLQNWFQNEREAGNLIDIKFFPGDRVSAKAVYETVTGARLMRRLDPSKF